MEGYYVALFSPDGKRIATLIDNDGTQNGKTRIWDAESGKELQKLGGSMGFWEAAWSFSPDGKKTFTVTNDRGSIPWDTEIIIWAVESGKELLKLKGRFGAFSLDGKNLLQPM